MPPKKKGKEEESKGPVLLGRPGNNVKMGIVGLPNVGKSTFFNVLCNMHVEAENRPFCTIDPNVAQVPVPDSRFDHLCKVYKPKSEVKAVLTVTDIAGLIRGASEGSGLGNAFLSHIAAVDGIYHMCRAFESDEVVHVDGDIDPVRDLETVHDELRKKDLQWVSNNIEKKEKNVQRGIGGKDAKEEFDVLVKAKEHLEAGNDIRYGEWAQTDIEVLNQCQFLSAKPVIYLVNLSEKAFLKKKSKWLPKLSEWLQAKGGYDKMIPFSAEFEQKLIDLGGVESEEAQKYCKEVGAKSMLPKIINSGYHSLNLQHFFTAGADEVRAWTVRKGTLAPKAAGTIHTDFEKGFICADTISYEDLKAAGSEKAAKDEGKMRTEGRKYEVQDGDIMHFKFNLGKGK
eukprot:gb/GECG01016262.1/.p1 GENE.gb/GECG01016262.1/~~gb/GECG01016262.1/.p1  ORF type:complete len:398 (+),score=68.58 gb/GECG01016262.1/:1-1194(+)